MKKRWITLLLPLSLFSSPFVELGGFVEKRYEEEDSQTYAGARLYYAFGNETGLQLTGLHQFGCRHHPLFQYRQALEWHLPIKELRIAPLIGWEVSYYEMEYKNNQNTLFTKIGLPIGAKIRVINQPVSIWLKAIHRVPIAELLVYEDTEKTKNEEKINTPTFTVGLKTAYSYCDWIYLSIEGEAESTYKLDLKKLEGTLGVNFNF